MAFRLLPGDDIFISYPRQGASTYASGLADELLKRGFSPFVDRFDTKPNPTLTDELRRKIRECKMLVIIGTKRAGSRPMIEAEIREYLSTGRQSIVPIDFNNSIEKARWYSLIRGIPLEPEPRLLALKDGNPSDSVLNRIEKQFTYKRTKQSQRRTTLALSALSIFFTLISIGAGLYAATQVAAAKQARSDALQAQSARNQAETERGIAQGERDTAKTDAKTAKEEAEKAGREAVAATAEAIKQANIAEQRKNEAAAATLEAEKQTKIAGERRREAESTKINTSIMELQATQPTRVRERAGKAIQAFRNYANPRSSQLLAEALTSANHYVRRFSLPDEKPVVSRNGMYAVSWNEAAAKLTVYRLENKLQHYWTYALSGTRGSYRLQALAVANDGLHVALNWNEEREPKLIVLRAIKERGQTIRAQEIYRDVRSPERTLRFDALTFSPDGQYLWGLQAVMGMDPRLHPHPIVYRIRASVETLKIPLPPNVDWVRDVQVSEESEYVALLTSHKEAPSLISVFQLPGLQPVTAFASPAPDATSLAFDEGAKNMLVVGTPSSNQAPHLYTVIKNWRTSDRKADMVGENILKTTVPEPRRFAFIPGTEAAVLLRRMGVGWDPTTARPRARATIIEDYAGYPDVIGDIVNTGPDIDSLVNSGDITSAGVLKNDKLLVTTDLGGNITVWEPFFRYGAPRFKFSEQVTDLHVSEKGNRLLIADLTFSTRSEGGGYPEKVRLNEVENWSGFSPRVSTRLEVPAPPRSEVAFSRDGTLVGNVEYELKADGKTREVVFRIYSLLTGKPVRTLRNDAMQDAFGEDIADIAFSPDRNAFVAVNGVGLIAVWSLMSKQDTPQVQFEMGKRFSHGQIIAFSRDSSILLTSYSNKLITWTEWKSPRPVKFAELVLTDGNGEGAIASSIAVSARDKYILVGTGDGIVKVWEDWKGTQPKLVRSFTTELNPTYNQPARVMSLDFHPTDEKTFAVLDRLGVKLYTLDENEPLVRLPRHSSDSSARVRFSADGRYLISTAYRKRDYVFWLWNPNELIKDACDSFLVDPSRMEPDNVCSSSVTAMRK